MEDIKITAVEVIQVYPGDIVVYKTDEFLSNYAKVQIMKELISTFPNNKCVICDEGAALQVIRQESK